MFMKLQKDITSLGQAMLENGNLVPLVQVDISAGNPHLSIMIITDR